VWGSVLVETTILYMSTRHNPAQVLSQAAVLYKVDTDAIALKVKQEFAAKEKAKATQKAQPNLRQRLPRPRHKQTLVRVRGLPSGRPLFSWPVFPP
jgi:hypothetical protein